MAEPGSRRPQVSPSAPERGVASVILLGKGTNGIEMKDHMKNLIDSRKSGGRDVKGARGG